MKTKTIIVVLLVGLSVCNAKAETRTELDVMEARERLEHEMESKRTAFIPVVNGIHGSGHWCQTKWIMLLPIGNIFETTFLRLKVIFIKKESTSILTQGPILIFALLFRQVVR